ncbi:hypothetical protein [Sorangium sp. So ce854]|uniref:hypothetical protein n=1 Tax=Sorangium sp. So ce854 TaxID=3133322 RepID=UPI003F6049E5
MMNWYCPVSTIWMLVSVACVVVVTTARRGSLGGVVQRVCQERALPDAECLLRASPGICSQHAAVLHGRPAPEIESSEPCCWICTAPPGAPCGRGLGPHASPHAAIDHCSVSGLAVHDPLSVGRSCAAPVRGKAAAAASDEARSAGSRAGEASSGRRTAEP